MRERNGKNQTDRHIRRHGEIHAYIKSDLQTKTIEAPTGTREGTGVGNGHGQQTRGKRINGNRHASILTRRQMGLCLSSFRRLRARVNPDELYRCGAHTCTATSNVKTAPRGKPSPFPRWAYQPELCHHPSARHELHPVHCQASN